MIVRSDTLDHNIFSIKLPNGPHEFLGSRTNGELVIGGVDPKYSDHEFVTLPVTPTTPDSWSVKVDSVSWGDGKSLQQDFSNCVATFSTSTPFILLPGIWTDGLHQFIGAREHDGFFKGFPCSNREFLPDLTFVLAGKEISLTPYEYSFESVGYDGDPISCLVGFDQSSEDVIELGWPFLEYFISVFDQDLKEIRREVPFCARYTGN